MHTITAPTPRSTPRPPVRANPRPVARSAARPAPHAVLEPTPSVGRRRVVGVACAAVVALTAIAIGFGVGHASAESDGVPAPRAVYVVQPGDTLWAIAGKVAPGINPARAVDALRSAAGGSALTPGQRIALPDSLS